MLIMAASRGHDEMVSTLLAFKAKLNLATTKKINGHNLTALMLAAAHGHRQVVLRLLDAGASMRDIDKVLERARQDGVLSEVQFRDIAKCCCPGEDCCHRCRAGCTAAALKELAKLHERAQPPQAAADDCSASGTATPPSSEVEYSSGVSAAA